MSTDQRDGGRTGDVQGPTVPRMLVGIQLHRFREAAGITPDQAAYEIRASRSKISRMENGLVRFKERDVTDLLTLYGITDEQTRSGWSVVVTGRAEVIYEDAEIQRLSRLGLHPWVTAAERPFWIRIRANAVSGRATPEAR